MPINIDTLTFEDEDPLDALPPHVRTDLQRLALRLFLAVLAVEALVVVVLLFCIPDGGRQQRANPSQPVKTLFVLGSGAPSTACRLHTDVMQACMMIGCKLGAVRPSIERQHPNAHAGGHTAEMLRLVNSLDKQLYRPRVYVTAETDALSGKKAVEAEKGFNPNVRATSSAAASHHHDAACIDVIARRYCTRSANVCQWMCATRHGHARRALPAQPTLTGTPSHAAERCAISSSSLAANRLSVGSRWPTRC